MHPLRRAISGPETSRRRPNPDGFFVCGFQCESEPGPIAFIWNSDFLWHRAVCTKESKRDSLCPLWTKRCLEEPITSKIF